MKTKQLIDAGKKDAVFQASIEFIGTLTGMKPPPIETAPPETFAPFRAFTERVCEIFAALEADIAKPAEPHGWLIDGSLLYRLNDHGSNCDEINVSMANGSRTPEIRAFVAAALLTRITTPQEPALPQALIKALEDAAMSLETISRLAGRATYGNPPIESYMGEHTEVRMYAKSRTEAARQSLASPGGAA